MAYTTRGISWVHDTCRRESPSQDTGSKGTITIEVENGAVAAVHGLPENYQYEILDHDLDCIAGEPKPEPEFLYLATVNILVRAKSPDHAAGAIIHIMSDYDMDNGTLLDWDYATLDGWRQYPRFVSSNLEAWKIDKLLGLLNTYMRRSP